MIRSLHTFKQFLFDIRDRQRIAIAISKGYAGMQTRKLVESNPQSWEFSGFSQNGEDGILQMLCSKLQSSNRYFAEIGAADGIQNNTAWLCVVERYDGLMIEGSPQLAERARRVTQELNIGLLYKNMFVTRDSAPEIRAMMLHADPDVFSLDIDGVDYYIAKALFEAGIRPKIFVVEYNSVYGPERAVTVPYGDSFNIGKHPSELYYGVSVTGWRKLFTQQGYEFLTVDRHGVNAFFVDPMFFDRDFLAQVKGVEFAENVYQRDKFNMSHDRQFSLISDCELVQI
jgi:hypothetical protein